jgi:multiple sugar transport system substrate-binding protein
MTNTAKPSASRVSRRLALLFAATGGTAALLTACGGKVTTTATTAASGPATNGTTTRAVVAGSASTVATTQAQSPSTTASRVASSPATSVAGAQRPLVVQQWDAPTSPFGKWLLTYLQAFPKQSGIQLDIRQHTGDAAQEQSVWVASGDVPDVFFRTGRGAIPYAAFVDKKVIQPLDAYVKKDNFDLSDFWPRVIELMTSQGHLWVIPQDFNQELFGYNPAFLQTAGVKAPPSDWTDRSWTWATFLQTAQQTQHYLTTQSGAGRYAYGRPNSSWQLWVWTNGGDLLDANWQQIALDQPAALEALDFAAKLAQTEHVAPRPADKLPAGTTLGSLAVAMDALWAAGFNNLRGGTKSMDFDTALFPRGAGDYAAYGGGGGYVMSATSKQPEAAWTLLKYIGAPEYARQKVTAGALGPRISTAKQYFVQAGIPPAHAAVYFDAPAHAHWEPNLTNWPDVATAIDKALLPLWQGQQNAKDAVAGGKAAIEALIKQGSALH